MPSFAANSVDYSVPIFSMNLILTVMLSTGLDLGSDNCPRRSRQQIQEDSTEIPDSEPPRRDVLLSSGETEGQKSNRFLINVAKVFGCLMDY